MDFLQHEKKKRKCGEAPGGHASCLLSSCTRVPRCLEHCMMLLSVSAAKRRETVHNHRHLQPMDLCRCALANASNFSTMCRGDTNLFAPEHAAAHSIQAAATGFAARKEEAKMWRSSWRPCKLLVVFMHKSAAMSGTLHDVIERKAPRSAAKRFTTTDSG